MKKTVWTFGLISGAILSVMMLLTIPFVDMGTSGMVIGYTTMVLAGLLIYFGVRSYRDNVLGGTISFGRAMAVGTLIVVISSLCYVATWELIFFKLQPTFGAKFEAKMVANAKASGASQAVIDQKVKEAEQFAASYQNPLFNAAITFLEPLPVGVVMALLSAGVLRRKRRPEGAMDTAPVVA